MDLFTASLRHQQQSSRLAGLFNGPFNTIKVTSSRSVHLTTLFSGQALSSKRFTSTCANSFARNCQLPFLNQRKGKNDCRKYFLINLHERMLPDPSRIEPASKWATEASSRYIVTYIVVSTKNKSECFSCFSIKRCCGYSSEVPQ